MLNSKYMLTKKFLKMDRDQQERILVDKLTKLYSEEIVLRRILAQIRGKNKIEKSEIDRLDLYDLKTTN